MCEYSWRKYRKKDVRPNSLFIVVYLKLTIITYYVTAEGKKNDCIINICGCSQCIAM